MLGLLSASFEATPARMRFAGVSAILVSFWSRYSLATAWRCCMYRSSGPVITALLPLRGSLWGSALLRVERSGVPRELPVFRRPVPPPRCGRSSMLGSRTSANHHPQGNDQCQGLGGLLGVGEGLRHQTRQSFLVFPPLVFLRAYPEKSLEDDLVLFQCGPAG